MERLAQGVLVKQREAEGGTYCWEMDPGLGRSGGMSLPELLFPAVIANIACCSLFALVVASENLGLFLFCTLEWNLLQDVGGL